MPLLVLVTACGAAGGGGERARLRVVVVRPPHDTVRFTAPAEAHRCGHGGGGGVVLEGLKEGDGALLRARAGDSVVSGAYPVFTRGDTATARGAIVGVRWTTIPEDARGVTLDTGSVTVTVQRPGPTIAARASGSGLEPSAGRRVTLEVTFTAVPLGPDTVSCAVRL